MGWFTDALENLDQGYYSQGFDLDALRKGWNLEEQYDFEDIWRDSPQSSRGWDDRTKASLRRGTIGDAFLDHTSYIASVPLNLVFDPVNTLGFGLFTKPYAAVKGLKGGREAADEAKGLYTTSAPNYIKAIAKADEAMNRAGLPREMFKGNPDLNLKSYEAMRNPFLAQAKAKELVDWGALGVSNALKNVASPHNRALYRETGINKPMMESPFQSQKAIQDIGKGREVELIHRTFANRHIGEQAGRVGDSKALDEMLSKGFHSTYHTNSLGTYQELAKDFVKGSDAKVTTKDFSDIEKHLGVWKDGKGREFGFDPNSKIIIKKAKSPYSGDHWEDWQRSPVLNQLAGAFHVSKKVPKTPKALAKYLEREGVKLPGMKVASDGITFSWSKPGSSITEGGVNMWAKLKPDGKLVGVMSDEHNLFEKLPFMNRAVPNRVVAITPPMTADIRKLKSRQTGYVKPPTPKIQGSSVPWKGEVNRLVNRATPSEEYLNLEKKALAARAIGGGMLGINNLAPEPVFRDSSYNWNNTD